MLTFNTRNLDILERFLNDESSTKLSSDYDLSRTRIYQILDKQSRKEIRRFCLAFPGIARLKIAEWLLEKNKDMPSRLKILTIELLAHNPRSTYRKSLDIAGYNHDLEVMRDEDSCKKIDYVGLCNYLWDTIGGYSRSEQGL